MRGRVLRDADSYLACGSREVLHRISADAAISRAMGNMHRLVFARRDHAQDTAANARLIKAYVRNAREALDQVERHLTAIGGP